MIHEVPRAPQWRFQCDRCGYIGSLRYAKETAISDQAHHSCADYETKR